VIPADIVSLGRAIERGLRGARRNPLVQLVAVGTIALALLLVGTLELLAKNVRHLASSWGADVQMTVYLDDGLPTGRAEQIAEALRKLPGVSAVHNVEPHQAWLRLRRSLAGRADLLDGIEEGFLPASLEVALEPGVAEVIRAHPTFEKLRHLAGVDEVELVGDWAARLHKLEAGIRNTALTVGLLVLLACLYVVGSNIRLGVFARRDEIEILKLVGATDRYVKAPFLVEGALQGALGAALAGGLLFSLFLLAAPRLETALGTLLLGGQPLTFFRPLELGIAVALGTLMGLAGSAIALGRYVRL
jgi:cell division transport system permease protein